MTAFETSGDLYPTMSLRRPDGSVLCTAYGPIQFTKQCTLDAAGTHTIWMYSRSGDEAGGFSLYYASSLYTPVWETLGGSYANDAPCQGGTADPITTVLLTTSTTASDALQLTSDRLYEIGMTSGYNPLWTTKDSFRDEGGCVEGEITRATNEGWQACTTPPLFICTVSRWHARGNLYSVPSAFGYWSPVTPHWEAPACPRDLTGVENHYVPAVYNGPENYSGSGFDAGRDWLCWQLVHQYGMQDMGSVSYDNRAAS